MNDFTLGDFHWPNPFTAKFEGGIFSPADIADLHWWLDAADASTVTTTGSNVTQWDDKSGNGKDVVQATMVNQPLYGLGAQAGNNIISFTTPAFLESSGTMNFDTNIDDYTIFIVYKADSATMSNTLIGTAPTGGNSGTLITSRGTAPDTSLRFLHRQPPSQSGGDNLSTDAGVLGDKIPTLIRVERDLSTRQEGFVNTTSLGSITPVQAAHTADISVGIGVLTPFVLDRHLEGFIGEIVMYSRLLTGGEITSVTNYLETKWDVAFNPLSLGGCVLWLDADDAGTITKDGSDFVSQWDDKSFEGNDVLQATSSDQPQWLDATLNNKPVIRFDGSNDQLESIFDASLSLTSTMTIFVVSKSTSISGTARLVSTDGYGYGRSTDKGLFTTFGITDYTSVATMWDASNYQVAVMTLDSSSDVNFFKNGSFVETVTGASGPNASTTGIAIGSTPTPDEFWEGDISEVIIYNRELTPSQMGAVDVYLNSKWAVY